MSVLALVKGSGNRNLGFGFWKYRGEMRLRQVEQGFSSFFEIFVYFFKVERIEGVAKQ